MLPADATHTLRAVRDPELRVMALLGAWSRGDAGAWMAWLRDVVAHAHRTDDAAALAALETVARAAGHPRLDDATRQRLYEAAIDADQRALARLFFAVSPATVDEHQLEKLLAAERPLTPRERPLTLGERKALARSHRRQLLIALCRDPHPDVVTILLDNPHVTEADIVRVAALRPAVPAALRKIAAHPRWTLRHQVKRALVWNPGTPLDVAVRLATTLRAGELRELAATPSLPVALRGHAAELLASVRR